MATTDGVLRAADAAALGAVAGATRLPDPPVLTPEQLQRMVARVEQGVAEALRDDPGLLVLAHEEDVVLVRAAIAILTDRGEPLRRVEVRASPLVMTRGEAFVMDLAEAEKAETRLLSRPRVVSLAPLRRRPRPIDITTV